MTVSDIRTRSLERLNEDPARPVYYTAADVLATLNLFQRIYAFLTLCLEEQRTFRLTPGDQWYQVQQSFTDMILVLRCEYATDQAGNDSTVGVPITGLIAPNDESATPATAATPKLQPATLQQMTALSNDWYGAGGQPTRYTSLGFGLLVFDRSPDDAYLPLITYARMPVALVNDTDSPEIPEPDHQCLIDACVGFLRIREGGQELQNEAQNLQSFLAAVKRRAAQVRMRSLAQRYDHAPPEIEMPDLSRLLKIRPDLAPNRKGAAWTSPQ